MSLNYIPLGCEGNGKLREIVMALDSGDYKEARRKAEDYCRNNEEIDRVRVRQVIGILWQRLLRGDDKVLYSISEAFNGEPFYGSSLAHESFRARQN